MLKTERLTINVSFKCFARSLTFPVVTKLLINVDLWRLREAFGLSV